MRRFGLAVFACALLAPVRFVVAQQVDFAVGASTLWSSQNTTAAIGFLPPAEKGGMYPSASLQYVSPRRLGFNAELAFRDKKAIYNGFQPYRPFLYDVNAVYAPRFNKKSGGDFMAGIGGQTVLFYNEFGACGLSASGCRININSTHFLVHAGADVKYYFWRNFFARPEAHWYYVINNVQFHSNNVFRVGLSLGHTFGSR
ncbi:MAG TPA: hypothetical protein VFA67_03470 [Candidatus Sulfotelmatobacter sp.]|nr:hypothetical protein [Candidatus Sulfotelmatobacter sp.]